MTVQILTRTKVQILAGRELAGGEEAFQLYFSDVLPQDSEVRAMFGAELGAYKLVQKNL